ncbi:MAG: Type secretion system secreted protein Hcp [Rhizobacter sp.]|nr:Type secretion system secreted protein Hcp [Rhizobacter sp.]
MDGGASIYLSLTLANGSKVEGEATAMGFAGQIEVTDFSWGVGAPPAVAKMNMEMPDLEVRKASHPDDTMPAAQRLLSNQVLKLRPPPMAVPSSRTLTRVPLRDVTFSKRFDISSTVLMKALNSMDLMTEAKFTVLRRGESDGSGEGTFHRAMFVVTLSSVHIKQVSIDLAGQDGGLAVVDTVTLGYKDIEIEYSPKGQKDSMTFSHKTAAKKWAPVKA